MFKMKNLKLQKRSFFRVDHNYFNYHKISIASCIFIMLLSATIAKSKERVFDYYDFGPQSLSYELLGYGWWQWNATGDGVNKVLDIKVVVYWDTCLDSIKLKYPVNKNNLKDYRYVRFYRAVEYLTFAQSELLKINLDTSKLNKVLRTLLKLKSIK